jgi:hypothetical protein
MPRWPVLSRLTICNGPIAGMCAPGQPRARLLLPSSNPEVHTYVMGCGMWVCPFLGGDSLDQVVDEGGGLRRELDSA